MYSLCFDLRVRNRCPRNQCDVERISGYLIKNRPVGFAHQSLGAIALNGASHLAACNKYDLSWPLFGPPHNENDITAAAGRSLLE